MFKGNMVKEVVCYVLFSGQGEDHLFKNGFFGDEAWCSGHPFF